LVSKIEHIGVVVKDLKKSLRPYQELLGLDLKEIEEIEVQGSMNRVAFLPVGEVNIELVETSATSGLAADFQREKGEGIHHIAFKVDDLETLFRELKDRGVKFLWDKIIPGSRGSRVAFFKAEEFNGVYIELVQKIEGGS
jgi:methylmalonyl-CoA/ethylmalonyl-CoA epimerase